MSRTQSAQGLESPGRTWLPWLAGGLFILLFALRDLLLTDGLVIERNVVWGRDFINVWTGGHLVREGRLSTLYDPAAYSSYQQTLFGPLGPHNYSYPPVSFPIAALFSLLPYPVALVLWQLAGAAFFVWAARPWWPKRIGPAWLAVLTPAALLNLWAGHYGFFVGGLFLFGWRMVEQERRLLAGACFGLMMIKPHLAILVPLALALRREWLVIASAAITAGLLVLLTGFAFGWQPWTDFLFGTSKVQAGLIDAGQRFFGYMSTSPMTAAFELGASWKLALLVQILFAGAAIVAVITAASRGANIRQLALLTATATFLVLPYAFNYDMTVVMIGALSIMSARRASTTDWRLAFYGFVGPQIGMITAALGVPLMPLMTAGLALAQLRQVRKQAPVEEFIPATT